MVNPSKTKKNSFLTHAQVELPLICGAMYPCSNPELVAAVSEAGGLGVVQPLSLTYVHGYDLREGLQKIQSLTSRPVGFNILVEQSAKVYFKRMEQYLKIALDEGIRFFVTALGDPSWVVDAVKEKGGVVYHDVVNRRHAEKALACGAEGLICVNSRAGGHAGKTEPEDLYKELADLNVPLVCAGGVGSTESFRSALSLGYQAVQMGTRFIASEECHAHSDYKTAIIEAKQDDIVLTNRVTGVDLAVIRTPYFDRVGYKVNPLLGYLLKQRWSKHWTRLALQLQSFVKLKSSNFKARSTKDLWQAGKSVEGVKSVETVNEIVAPFREAYSEWKRSV